MSWERFSASDQRRLAATVRRQPTDRVPNYEVVMMAPAVSYILGKPCPHSWEIDAADTIELAHRLGMGAMCVPFSWTAYAPGEAGVRNYEGAVRTWDDLRRIDRSNVSELLGEFRRRMEALLGAAREGDVGIVPSPSMIMDMTRYTMGFEHFMLALYDIPDLVEAVMDVYTDVFEAGVRAAIEYPVVFLHVGDDLAGKQGPFVSPAVLRRLWMPRVARAIAPALEAGVPVMFHCDGGLAEILPMVVELGFCGINPIEPYGNDIYAIKREYGDRLCLMGNMDVAGPLAFGTPEQVEADTRQHLERLMPGGRYIAASSHSITEGVRPENFLAMTRAIHQYGVYGSPGG